MPKTLHLDAALSADIAVAADLLRAGLLVAFATETVYGLGANALSPEAVARIFSAKQRPAWDPLIVHIASVAQLTAIVTVPTEIEARVAALAEAFWPGPLTLLLPRSTAIADAVTSGRPLVGVRVPAHPAAQALLQATGLPVAAPSANLFGHTSPTTAAHVLADLDGHIEAVLDAGPATIGVESTVLDPTQTPMVLYRPGAVTAEQLTAVTGAVVRVHSSANTPASTPRQALPAPGVGLRHYAPHARLELVSPNSAALLAACNGADMHEQTAVLLPIGWPAPPNQLAPIIVPWADWTDAEALASALFSALRAADDRGATLILCPLPPAGGLADAIRDRLLKAATPA